MSICVQKMTPILTLRLLIVWPWNLARIKYIYRSFEKWAWRLQALAQAPQRCGLVNHGISKSAKFCSKNPKKVVYRVRMGWYDFLALSELKNTQNVANPRKKIFGRNFYAFFWNFEIFGPKIAKNRFFEISSSFISKAKYLWKKAFGALGSLFKHLILLKQKNTKMVYFWFFKRLKIAKIA